jgi:hypothetical protein
MDDMARNDNKNNTDDNNNNNNNDNTSDSARQIIQLQAEVIRSASAPSIVAAAEAACEALEELVRIARSNDREMVRWLGANPLVGDAEALAVCGRSYLRQGIMRADELSDIHSSLVAMLRDFLNEGRHDAVYRARADARFYFA